MRLKLRMKGRHTESLFSPILPKTNKPQPRLMVSSFRLAFMALVTRCWLLTGPGRAKQRATKNMPSPSSIPILNLMPNPLQQEAAWRPSPLPGVLLLARPSCCVVGPPGVIDKPRRPREEEGRPSVGRGSASASPRGMGNLCLGGCGDQAYVWALPSRLHIK